MGMRLLFLVTLFVTQIYATENQLVNSLIGAKLGKIKFLMNGAKSMQKEIKTLGSTIYYGNKTKPIVKDNQEGFFSLKKERPVDFNLKIKKIPSIKKVGITDIKILKNGYMK